MFYNIPKQFNTIMLLINDYDYMIIKSLINVYSRFHETLTTNFPNFVVKFTRLLWSSQDCCEVQKFIMRFTNQFVSYAFDWLLLLHGPIRDFVYKLACEFQYELPNFATNLRTSQRSSEHLWSKLCEIDCKIVPGVGHFPLSACPRA
jgi:hypothetical protein